jgi:carbamoyl-phosphate synthase small subunit
MTGKVVKFVLEDSTEMAGQAFGAYRAIGGEVVFNTGMTGYVETLTDPSYRGQILVFTYPLVGNYGVPPPRPAGSIDRPYESDRIQVQGLVVQNYVDAYSHHAANRSLRQWLISEDIPAITGIDTRTLTRRLRESGTMKGWLFPAGMGLDEAQENADTVGMQDEVFRLVAPNEPVHYRGGELTILLVDVGAKDNIVRSLQKRGVSVLRVPWHARLSDFTDRADGVVVGNGPGDPKDLGSLVDQLRHLLNDFGKPIFGICLGNQLLALAAGGDTYKLPLQ